MRSWAAIAMLTGMSGCFYLDSINQRPGAQIELVDADKIRFRGDEVSLRANTNDPEGDVVSYLWRAYACGAPIADEEDCDAVPFASGALAEITFAIADARDAGTAPTNIVVKLQVTDEFGAVALPLPQVTIPVAGRAPTLELAAFSRYAAGGTFVENAPIDLFARVSDGDDGPAALTLAWELLPPVGGTTAFVAPTSTTIPDPDPAFLQLGRQVVPNVTGSWELRVRATDPSNNVVEDSIELIVVPDGAPCLAQLQPIIPPVGNALPITAPTLFRVPVVADDLDPYPLVPNDPIFRAPKFQWSIQPPGGSTHVVVPNATSNSLAIDPASFATGDILEVRVQIYDRKNTVIPCADGEATCSTISDVSCRQRQTWRVEIR